MLLTVAGLSIITGFRTILRRVVPLRGVGVTDVGAGGFACPASVAHLTTFAPNRSKSFRAGYEFGSPHNTENTFCIFVTLSATRLPNGILYAKRDGLLITVANRSRLSIFFFASSGLEFPISTHTLSISFPRVFVNDVVIALSSFACAIA